STVRSIAQTNRSLVELVDNFLQYARVEAGVAAPSTDRLVTRTLVAELEALGAVLAKPSVRFVTAVGEMPEAFIADSVKLRTILRNLIGNAAKFTARGTIALEIGATAAALVFRIRDTGPGIAPDKQRAVFEPFRQLDGAAVAGGVGLGLALSHRLARILG